MGPILAKTQKVHKHDYNFVLSMTCICKNKKHHTLKPDLANYGLVTMIILFKRIYETQNSRNTNKNMQYMIILSKRIYETQDMQYMIILSKRIYETQIGHAVQIKQQ